MTYKSSDAVSRREFTQALVAVPFALRMQGSPRRARIKVDTERVIGEIDPKIYGNFVEHLGRCIEGGIFDEGSPLADGRGFRRDVLAAVKDLNVTQLRWPGGNFVSNYHWQDGIGPRDQRPRRLEMAWGTIESNRFGTHEFLDYAEEIRTEPYFCVNLGTGTWTEAQQWVEYVNSRQDTAMTRLRKQNGRQDPWKVTYWGLGNEMDGSWQMGHKSAEDYGKFALEAAKLMRWTDPSIKLVAAGSSNYGSDWVGWNRTVLQYLKRQVDYLAIHLYVGNRDDNYYEFLTSSVDMTERIRKTEGVINAALTGEPRTKKIHIAFDEYNVWYRARGSDALGKDQGRNILEERYNLEDALVIATFLNTFVNQAQIVKIANMAQLVNVIAPIFTNGKSMFLQTIYYPLQLFAKNVKGQALELFVDSPGYESKRFGLVPYLDVSASYDKSDNGTLMLNVVNRHLDQPIEVEIEAQDKRFTGTVEVAEVNGPEIKAQNDFGSTKVKTVTRTVTADGRRMVYRFPAHSFTMLKVKLAEVG